jgi:sterol 3beta-glucosyltransferase
VPSAVESGVAGASSGECVLRKTGLNLPAFGDGQVSAELARPAFPWLAVISAHLHPRPTDWEAHCQIVGPLVVPANETLSSTPPDPTLVSFLAAGPPPVYVGWGSMVCVSPEHMTTVACEGLMRAGARGVVLAGFAQLRHALLQPGTELAQYAAEHVYFGDDLAHEWLFPQCAMTVHHGGTGTTHAALRAGKPTIITPVLPTDQYTFARLVHERGVGVPLPHLRKVTPHMLASAITLASSERMVAAAAELGRRMSAEDGNAECVRHLEIYLEEKVFNGAWRADFQARWLDLA